MLKWDYSIYLGNEEANIHVDFISDENIFIIVEIKNNIKKEEIKALLVSIKDEILKKKINDLDQFKELIDERTAAWQGHTSFAIAAAFSVEDILYLITRGKGKVFIGRDRVIHNLISGHNMSSGYIQDGDYLILTTEAFSEKVNDKHLSQVVFGNNPQGVIEALTPELKADDDTGLIALFAQSIEDKEVPITENLEQAALPISNAQQESPSTSKFDEFISRFKGGSSRSRYITFGIVVVLLIIFIWSVVLGNERRVKQNFLIEIQEQERVVDSKLSEARELATVNIQKSLTLLEESQAIYVDLNNRAKEKNLQNLEELSGLKSKIEQTEQDIKKTEEGQSSEFYDLNLISKGTQASGMYYSDGVIGLLDKENGKVHLVSIEKKSVESRKANKIKDAQFVALHNGDPYVFSTKDGVIKIDSSNKAENVIKKDSDWKSVKDFWIYNGNIYILDSGNDEVYKYLVAEEGYSNKTSYFGSGQAIDLDSATALSIDVSIYVAVGSDVYKFVSGVRDSFSVTIPDDEVDFEDIYTDQDIDNIYLLDRDSGRIFIVSKNGEFKKQISASLITKADDFVVVEEQGALVLVKDKIYKIELD